jgi:serine/threonine protein kinase
MGDLGTLLAVIEDTITPAHQLTIAQQVCSGMEALASAGHIHRDLATRNVLVFAYDEANPTVTSVKVRQLRRRQASAHITLHLLHPRHARAFQHQLTHICASPIHFPQGV